jgi:hypothetical protein
VHRGCTSAGTDARVCSTVRARVRHVIDRGGGCTVCKASCPSLGIGRKSNSRLLQGAKGVVSIVQKKGGENMEEK